MCQMGNLRQAVRMQGSRSCGSLRRRGVPKIGTIAAEDSCVWDRAGYLPLSQMGLTTQRSRQRFDPQHEHARTRGRVTANRTLPRHPVGQAAHRERDRTALRPRR